MSRLYGIGGKRSWIAMGVCCAAAAGLAIAALAQPQAGRQAGPKAVSVQVEIARDAQSSRVAAAQKGGEQDADAANVAVWLIATDGSRATSTAPAGAAPQLLQRNKTFSPHLLVVQAGSLVQFPNQDPFFHNVFSLFAGRRFDLSLYEAGSSRAVKFENPGASFLFCNIHPEMSAVIVVVPTPYFGLSEAGGRVNIGGVPDGRYQLKVWQERSSPEDLKALEQIVTVSPSSRSFGPIRIPVRANVTLSHKNKYGQDYPPALTNTAY